MTFETPWLESASLDEAAQRLRFLPIDYADDIVTRADAICRGTLTLLGTRSIAGSACDGRPIRFRWRDWPRVFHARIDIFGGATLYGDVKYVWELIGTSSANAGQGLSPDARPALRGRGRADDRPMD